MPDFVSTNTNSNEPLVLRELSMGERQRGSGGSTTNAATKTALAAIVFEGEGPNTAVDALNGRDIGGRKIAASTDRSVVINHEEQYS